MYLDRLGPLLVVPGNHDIPLYDVTRRALSPMGRYRSMLTDELNPFHVDNDLAVLGLNTTRPARWKEGGISPAQVQLIRIQLRRRRCRVPWRVLVTHHPFLPPPSLPKAIAVHCREAALRPSATRAWSCCWPATCTVGCADVVGGDGGPSVQGRNRVRAGAAGSPTPAT